MKTKSLLFLAITLLIPVMVCSTAQAAPTITVQPVNQTIVSVGDPVNLTVTAGGTGTLQYQWTMNGVPILDNVTAITASLSFTAAEGHNGAVFRCVITDDADDVTVYSDPATLIVLMSPLIITDPQDQTVTVSQRATFSVIARGNPALVYQWYWRPSGGSYAAIPGATRSSYRTVPTTMADDQSEYYCNVSNSVLPAGVDTAVATLTVEPRLPTFIIHPQNRTVEVGAVAVFRVWALGTDLEYQWQTRPSGGAWTDIAGAIDPAYSTGPVNVADHHDRRYRCRANNAGYTTYVYSNEGTVTVIGAATITSHPADQTVDNGQTATFSIAATGVGTLSYQWEKMPFGGAWAAIPGATGTSYTTPPATMADDRSQFRCNVTNAAGTVSSAGATLTVLGAGAPVITSHPANQTVYEGQTATFTVAATGTSPLTYQWEEMPPAGTWTAIPGETNTSYTTPLLVAADDGTSFRCIVTNGDGTATSGPGVLTVLTPSIPVVITHPSNQTVCEGGTATFSVVATDTVPLSYQWQEDPLGGGSPVDIPGATSASYTTLPTQMTDDTDQFICNVSNAAGTVASNPATLTVILVSIPVIVIDPSPQTVCIGETATFTVVVADTCPPFSYQWQNTGTDIPGATSASYTTPPVSAGDDASTFACVVTNSGGTATSATALLTVDGTLPTIVTDPLPQTACVGQTATFTVGATTSCPPLSYQWQDNASPIPGATSATYTTPALSVADDTHLFACVVTNAAGTTTSNTALLTVDQTLPTIVTDPLPQTACVGQTATFTVGATTSCPPLSYQWQDNGSPIPGATSATYTTPSLSIADDTHLFDCVVTNAAGPSTSNTALLTVDQTAPTILSQPASQSACIGQTVTFTIQATSSCLPLTYQWQEDPLGGGSPVDIPGATSASYTTPPVGTSDDTDEFICTVTNASGIPLASTAAVLTVDATAPTILTQPLNQAVFEGQTATFTVEANSACLPIFYQWQEDPLGGGSPVDIAGATSASYTTAPVAVGDNTDEFICVVTNAAGSTTSTPAILTVQAGVAPTITTDPASQTVNEGETATFTVVATGTPPLSYQWRRSTTNIPGATSASYTTPPVTLAESGDTFDCIVTNAIGSATSNSGTLTVQSGSPTITMDPLDQAVFEGQTATFTATAAGTAPLNYQWEKDPVGAVSWTLIPGATGASYTTPAAVLADNQADFRCTVTNTYGTATSNPATLTVQSSAPTITTQPLDQAVFEGQTAAFTVAATGVGPLFYQWEKMPSAGTWALIPGAIAATYNTPLAVLTDDQAQFRCTVTNAYGSDTSSAATLTVQSSAPTITTQPLDQAVFEGQVATFGVVVTGSAPLFYQWEKDPVGAVSWTPIPGAVLASYTTPAAVSADDQAQFRCTVTNAYGSDTSSAATLTVQSGVPAITTQPLSQAVFEGQVATFGVMATGSAPLFYQWEKMPSGGSWAPIPGAVIWSYTIPPAVSADDQAQFRCTVTNAYGSDTSNAATLTVAGSAPTITLHPSNQTVTDGQTASFSVAAIGSMPLTYQWQKMPFAGAWADIGGATSAGYVTLATTLADDQAQFRCRVTNSVGSATSNSATLTVQSGALPVITQQPQDQTVNEGDTATFSVVATGPGPLSYQWERDGSYITGANSSSYTTGSTVAADDGARFRCEVTNAGGMATSNEARLTVLTEPTAVFPFAEDFETGSLQDYWSTSATGKGRIQITALNGPASGAYHLTMDSYTWMSFSLNELVLNVNLEGQSGVTLSFEHKEFNDGNHVMPASFTGSHNSDGVAVSADGTTWYKVQGLTAADGVSSSWQVYEVDLDTAVAAAGISYNSAFKVKFQQYGNNPIVSSTFRFSDGFAFDNIELY